jgi:hypothetical protein
MAHVHRWDSSISIEELLQPPHARINTLKQREEKERARERAREIEREILTPA